VGLLTFVETKFFTKLLQEYLSDDGYAALQAALAAHPEAGDVIRGPGGLARPCGIFEISMHAHDADLMAAVRRAMGRSTAPSTITQEAFDSDEGHLKRLVRLQRGERAQPGDLWDYTQDLRYTEIQRPLLGYLLPVCLQAWHDDLRGTKGYGGFVEHFYPVLADRHVFDTHLTPQQTSAVSEFMRQAILQEIDDQRGLTHEGMNARPYRWIRALTTHGVLLPDIDSVWTSWWALGTIGRAVSAVQYISALMYPNEDNPVFAPWTSEGGGGAPCLWDFEGHLYTHRWLEPNVAFLRRTLTVSAVNDVLMRAVDGLTSEPEHEIASRMLGEFPTRSEMLAARCTELPTLLAQTQEPSTLLEWSF
jgi:hypothetical protein